MYQLTKIVFFLVVVSCGDGQPVVVEKEVPVENPNRPGGGGQPGQQPGPGKPISYAQMQGLLNANCAQCHAAADFMGSEAVLRRSRVLSELKTKNMPPNRGALSDGDRSLMINFF